MVVNKAGSPPPYCCPTWPPWHHRTFFNLRSVEFRSVHGSLFIVVGACKKIVRTKRGRNCWFSGQ